MLQPEIAPFADHHIEQLKKLSTYLENPSDDSLNNEDVENILKNARRALYRFRQCALDEWRMKERLEEKARTCFIEHRDK